MRCRRLFRGLGTHFISGSGGEDLMGEMGFVWPGILDLWEVQEVGERVCREYVWVVLTVS